MHVYLVNVIFIFLSIIIFTFHVLVLVLVLVLVTVTVHAIFNIIFPFISPSTFTFASKFNAAFIFLIAFSVIFQAPTISFYPSQLFFLAQAFGSQDQVIISINPPLNNKCRFRSTWLAVMTHSLTPKIMKLFSHGL